MRVILKLSMLLLLGSATCADGQGLRIKVTKAILDHIDQGSKTVTFNGRVYQYRLDEKNSMYTYAETQKPALSWRDLKVGETYYFELITDEQSGRDSDFKIVRYIAAQPLDD